MLGGWIVSDAKKLVERVVARDKFLYRGPDFLSWALVIITIIINNHYHKKLSSSSSTLFSGLKSR
jgi:hypothetical protein